MDRNTILLTIDLEDWFQVENFKNYINYSEWETSDWRFEKNTQKMLNILESHNVKATFFILGWNAKRAPSLIKEIRNQGHEIASHGYNHDLCTSLDESSLLNDLRDSKNILEDITGTDVIGYRAPSFSITEKTIELLKEVGYQYNSSYDNSGLNPRHGKINLDKYSKSGLAYFDNDGFIELPITNLQLAKHIIPWAGGGYFRFWPTKLFNAGVKKIIKKESGYIFYTHPWEYDPGQPRITQASLSNRFKHYINLNSCQKRLENFLSTFREMNFSTAKDYLLHNGLIKQNQTTNTLEK